MACKAPDPPPDLRPRPLAVLILITEVRRVEKQLVIYAGHLAESLVIRLAGDISPGQKRVLGQRFFSVLSVENDAHAAKVVYIAAGDNFNNPVIQDKLQLGMRLIRLEYRRFTVYNCLSVDKPV